jgi:hypothetical protein
MFLSPADNSHRPIWSCQRGVHTRPWRRVKRRRMASGSAVPSLRAVAICFYRHTAGKGDRSGWVASSSAGGRERRRGGQCWGVHALVRPSLATGACGRTPADDQRHGPAGFAHDDQPSAESSDLLGHGMISPLLGERVRGPKGFAPVPQAPHPPPSPAGRGSHRPSS